MYGYGKDLQEELKGLMPQTIQVTADQLIRTARNLGFEVVEKSSREFSCSVGEVVIARREGEYYEYVTFRRGGEKVTWSDRLTNGSADVIFVPYLSSGSMGSRGVMKYEISEKIMQVLGLAEEKKATLHAPVETLPFCPWQIAQESYNEFTLTVFHEEGKRMAAQFVAKLREQGLV